MVKIIGEGIYLRAFEMRDLSLLNVWHNDAELNRWTCGQKRYVSEDYDREWLMDKIHNNTTQVYAAICDKDQGQMVGYISLNDINYVNRTAQWGGVVIGYSGARNKGYATQAAVELFRYAFSQLGLNKITGRWMSGHPTSILMGRLLGFYQEGLLRQEVFKNGTFHDVLIMSILKSEFEAKYDETKSIAGNL